MKLNSKKYVITIAKYTVLEAIRNHLFLLSVICIFCIYGLGHFVGELAIFETRESQSAIVAFLTRLFIIFIAGLYVITSLSREFTEKTVEMVISCSLSRHDYLFGKLFGYLVLALLVSCLSSVPLYQYSESHQVMLWSFSLLCELLIIIIFNVFLLITFRNITIAFTAGTAFYVLCRNIGTFILISKSPVLESSDPSQKIIDCLIKFIAYIVPRLDQYTRTEWLVYNTGTAEDFIFVLLQTIIFTFFLVSAVLIDLQRRNI